MLFKKLFLFTIPLISIVHLYATADALTAVCERVSSYLPARYTVRISDDWKKAEGHITDGSGMGMFTMPCSRYENGNFRCNIVIENVYYGFFERTNINPQIKLEFEFYDTGFPLPWKDSYSCYKQT